MSTQICVIKVALLFVRLGERRQAVRHIRKLQTLGGPQESARYENRVFLGRF